MAIHDFTNSARVNNQANRFYFNTIRNRAAEVHPTLYPNAGNRLHSKVDLLVNTNQYYEVDVEGQAINLKRITYHTERAGEKSNVIRIIDPLSNNCSLDGAQRVYNMTQLLNATGSAFLRTGGEFRMRLKPNQAETTKFTGSIQSYFFQGYIRCN